MNLILSTCGTSILTNNGNDNLRKLLNQYANVKNSNDILSTDKNNIVKHINECKKTFTNSSFEDAKRSSAELN
ncbi:MAG: hypothetical protein LBF13_03420, partial [Campylobacteraceae bacterium]|nr:hypothetical protein [Campylobacteraceae bacterium]